MALTALVAALTGTAIGIPAADWLINAQGRASGIGAGITGSPPWGALSLVALAAMVVAAAGCALTAGPAAKRRDAWGH
jgi:putative ABC transport system permease protein